MTSKSDFPEEESARVDRGPLVAGMAILLADPGGPIEATNPLKGFKPSGTSSTGDRVLGDVTSKGGSGAAMTTGDDDSGARVPRQRAAGDEGHAKRFVARELRAEFPAVPTDHVTLLVECLWSHFEGAPVRDFVPLLVRKQAREELLDHLAAEATVSPLASPSAALPRSPSLRPEPSSP